MRRGASWCSSPTSCQIRGRHSLPPESIDDPTSCLCADIPAAGSGKPWTCPHGNGPRFRVAIVNGTREESAAAPYPRLVYACETIKHRIVVEQTSVEDYRYRSWNLPTFPPTAPSLQLSGTADSEGTGECRHAIYAFERGDTRIDVSEPGCDENDWPQGQVTVTIKGQSAGDWACE